MAKTSVINVLINGDARPLKKALNESGNGIANFSKRAAAGMAAAAAAIGAAAIGAGVALYKIGETFDEQADKIRIGTGATGDQLQALTKSFKKVASSVPADMDSVGTAITDLNVRLGLTGEPLEELAGQFLNLSRIAEVDLESSIHSITRVFGDWSIANADQAESLDKIYRAAQASGIGIDQLSDSVVKFGAPLRNLGFTFEESLALLGQFDKAGVNTQTVFAGLKAGVGKLAKAGEDVPTTFRRIVEEIQALGPGTEATALAIELFGQRAGPDLADAIAGGKFEIDALLDSINNGTDTINAAAADTADFSEKWQLLKNKVFVALAPLAEKVFDAVGRAIDKVLPYVDQLSAKFESFGAQLKPIGADVKSLGETTAKYGDELLVLGTALLGAATAFKAVAAATALFNLALSANPVVIAVAAIAALIAGLVAAYQRFEGVRNVVDAVWHAIRDAFQAAAPVVVDFVQGAWQALVDAFNAVAPVVQRMYESVVGVLTTLWQWIDANVVPTITAGIELIIAVFNRVAPVVQYVAQVVFDVMTTVRNIITSFVAAVWPIIEGFLATLVTAFQIGWTVLKNIVQGALNQIKIVIETVLGVIRGIFQFFTGLLNGDFSKAWQGLKTIASSAINGIKDTVGNVLRQVYDIFVGVWDAIVAFFRGIPGRISDIAGGMFNGIKNAFREAINFIIRGWNRLEFAVPGFKIGPIGYDGFTLGLPHIPELAKGGIVTSPTLAVIGEAGPEAVVPLSKYRMDSGGNGSTINLTVNAGMGADGTRIGQEIVRELLKYQRQNGALPLKVA